MAELTAAGTEDSSLGAAAVNLAERIDRADQISGRALASLTKALLELMPAAVRGEGHDRGTHYRGGAA